MQKDILKLSTSRLEKQIYQVRQVEASNELELLNRAVSFIQDLGYQIVFSNTELGIIYAEKAPSSELRFMTTMLEGPFESRPPGFRLGIVVTTNKVVDSQNYNVRIRIMRIWRRGAHEHVVLVDEYKQVSLYQELFRRFMN